MICCWQPAWFLWNFWILKWIDASESPFYIFIGTHTYFSILITYMFYIVYLKVLDSCSWIDLFSFFILSVFFFYYLKIFCFPLPVCPTRYIGSQRGLHQQMTRVMEIPFRRQKQWRSVEPAPVLALGFIFIMRRLCSISKSLHFFPFFHCKGLSGLLICTSSLLGLKEGSN